MKPSRLWGWAFVAGLLSIFLLVISIWGEIVDTYRAYKEKYHLQSIESLYKTLDDSFHRNGASEAFYMDVAKNVWTVMRYDWPNDVEYMPIQENWILYSLRIFDPLVSRYLLSDPTISLFSKVELPNHQRAFSRGFGICSQQALATADMLHGRYGLNARTAGLNGHVTVQILGPNDDNYIVDPSFRASVRGDVLHSELLSQEFLEKISLAKPTYFSIKDNYISANVGWGSYSKKSTRKQLVFLYGVSVSYYLKWLIPLLGVFFALFFLAKNKGQPAT